MKVAIKNKPHPGDFLIGIWKWEKNNKTLRFITREEDRRGKTWLQKEPTFSSDANLIYPSRKTEQTILGIEENGVVWFILTGSGDSLYFSYENTEEGHDTAKEEVLRIKEAYSNQV